MPVARSLEEEIKRGAEARQLLDNKYYKEAVKAVEDGIIAAMSSSGLGDESTHHRLVVSLQLLKQITRQIEQIVQTGQMSELQLKQTMGQRLKKVAGL